MKAELKNSYFEALVENVNDLIQVVDRKGVVTYSGKMLEEITGYTLEEARRLPPFYWLHPDDKGRIIKEYEEQLSKGFDNYLAHYRIITKNGQIKHIETRVGNALDNPSVKGIIAVVRDVTAREEAKQRIRKQAILHELMTDISKVFLNQDIQPAIENMLEKIGRFGEVDRAYVYLFDEKASHWNCLHEWRSAASEPYESIYYQQGFKANTAPWMEKQLLAGHIINFEHLDEMPSEASCSKAMFEKDQTLSILIIPLMANGKMLGFIGYDAVIKHKRWQEDDITALSICTEILTSALIRHESEQTLKQSLAISKAVIESTAEGIIVTGLGDNIMAYNHTFQKMWMIPGGILPQGKKSLAFEHAMKSVENLKEVLEKIELALNHPALDIQLTAFIKNGRVIDCISKPQIIDGQIAGRVWSNRDITDQLQAQREEREKGMALAQFESLKNQVNPHFLFNSLNVLSSLVHIDADLSEKFIDQLARSYRYLLEQKDNELVPLQTEIEFIKSFTFLLKIRFEEKLQVNINIDPGVKQRQLPPLTLQLLIENAVKHNIVSVESPLVIDIFNENKTSLVVRNNIQLREYHMPSTGVGQRNIKSRYQLFTPNPVEFLIENNQYIARIPLV